MDSRLHRLARLPMANNRRQPTEFGEFASKLSVFSTDVNEFASKLSAALFTEFASKLNVTPGACVRVCVRVLSPSLSPTWPWDSLPPYAFLIRSRGGYTGCWCLWTHRAVRYSKKAKNSKKPVDAVKTKIP